MCIICVSKSGVRQPSDITLRAIFRRNPHGAGYMYARDGKVTIHKGFMNIEDFLAAVHAEQFTPQDSVVYHFRISTQAGVNAPMTHPFPLSNQPRLMRSLDLTCRCGVAHNGIIQLTSDPDNKRYSDTAIFITDYLSKIIRKKADLRDPVTLELIWQLANSKFAIMDNSGYDRAVRRLILGVEGLCPQFRKAGAAFKCLAAVLAAVLRIVPAHSVQVDQCVYLLL